jgi:KDO2-lipid IV(A) lauroyltransferase
VVRKNLELAFPNKSIKERKRIEKENFRNLTDIFLETFKSTNIEENELKRRFIFKNPEVLEKIYNNNQDVIVMCSHYCSWEWVFGVGNITNFNINAVYKQLSNKYFDKLTKSRRSQYGANMIKTKDTYREISRLSKLEGLNFYGFASDQSPKKSKAVYWSNFLNNYVPIHVGAEVIAKKYNMALVFMDVQKIKRGFYEASFSLITKKPNDFKNYQITEEYIKLVEKQVRKKPEYYTWTHKRFKHRQKNPI